ncbi:uncharacterized protein PAN0_006c2816 [Moesziomyces antarcticus]|uniref:Uncharacterized protein n=2 Tax=Pseudozyma antarctica TaxID=84753 RepID=A0A081CD56_PSEA2|nr:uncharacterized protein PAN0_006c2816 [Moesziomyces antarcticus]GAK64602.1 conserved hypothetical protein [Moesziomyces antarcticus]
MHVRSSEGLGCSFDALATLSDPDPAGAACRHPIILISPIVAYVWLGTFSTVAMPTGLAEFTPYHSLAGGLMMAASLHTLLSKLGLVLGISGFFHSTVTSTLNKTGLRKDSTAPSIYSTVAPYFTAGIFAGGIILGLARPRIETELGVSILDNGGAVRSNSLLLSVAFGALVGFGTKLGNGCTSGHFLCGLSRFSLRSLVATATFFGVAVLTHVFNVFNVAKSATPTPAFGSAFASHLPAAFPKPNLGTLLALQLPALAYLAAPSVLQGGEPSDSTSKTRAAKQLLAAKIMALAVGVHFSFALGVSGMMRPSKVLGFLSLSPALVSSGRWDPSLAMVAIGGIIPASIAYFQQVKPKQDQLRRLSSSSKKPQDASSRLRPRLSLVAPEWRTPADPSKIDARLVLGAILFGLGWGATGLCPGPALASLASLGAEAVGRGSMSAVSDLFVFVATMAASGQLAAKI